MRPLLLALVLLAPLTAAELDISDRFYNAIRAGDTAAVRQLVQSGVDVNTKDRRGGTPLLYAAAVGTPQIMRLLIDAGADVNARTSFGATPLLWSAANAEKVRLLVEKGADVNARSKGGNTPIQIAAAQSGNVEVLRFLLAHGASLAEARNQIRQTPLLRAARTNDLAMVKLLLEAGEDVKARDGLGSTPLLFAATEGNIAMMKLLLAKGADVNAQTEPHPPRQVKNGPLDIGRLSPLMVAAGFSRSAAAVRLLLEAGADVNAQDVRGLTPLMLAVASDHADPEIVRLLLAAKPDLSIKSKEGETALTWAGKFQHNAILPAVKNASAGLPAWAPKPVNLERAGLEDVRQAAGKSLALVQKTTGTFLREGGCVSCHSQDIVGMATAVARSKGVQVDESAAAEVLRAIRLEFASRADLFLEREDGPADVILSTALLALAFQDVPGDRMTDAMVRSVASQQMPEGYWSSIGIVRPPTGDGHISRTAASIRVLRQYGPPALKDEMNQRIARAMSWLIHAEPTTTEDVVMQLLGATWGGADAPTRERLTGRLLALQRSGGGWAQTPYLSPDAYATGTALYALHEGGGVSPQQPAYQRGVRFLLSTQAADGSWYVASRAPKFQPYFESGFPYGHDQWISQWATGWGAIALTLAVPPNIAAR